MTDDETTIKTLDSDDTAFAESMDDMLTHGYAIIRFRPNGSVSTIPVTSVFGWED